MDKTNDPNLRSFIEVDENSYFPIQNLPYGVFRKKTGGRARVGMAIGNYVLDLATLEETNLLNTEKLTGQKFFSESTLNRFMAAGRPVWRDARETISELLSADNPTLRDNQTLRDAVLVPMEHTEMQMPVSIGDYTDFYSSIYHATNVGIMFRGKENALPPNWKWLPVAYHGRASSVVISGTPIHRPQGQSKADEADTPVFGPCRLLDFELEMGFFVGPGSSPGKPIPMDDAPEHIFGMLLVNDWSARDIQKWEYIPLGPFLSKNFATSISPWIVSMDALAPFRTKGPEQNPSPLPYLTCKEDWAYDIHLEVFIQSEQMDSPKQICQTNFQHMYWNIYQQLVHHTISGCNVNPGDLMASGTLSGPTPDSYASLLELAWRGSQPLQISDNETRSFIEDGDTISMTGWCNGQGYRVGFGEVVGKILPPIQIS